MIDRFKTLLKRFHRDESGAFIVLFGILAIVLVATSGAVVDYSAIEQARTRAQVALDGAALGLQPHVFDTDPVRDEAYFIDKAQLLLEERLGIDAGAQRVTVEVTSATIDARDGKLQLDATVEVPTHFVALVGIQSVRAHLMSEATRKRLNLEVAMVLDNSGSMASSSRMTKLKEAANSATDILFDDEDSQPNVFVSVIPFTQYVNVGTANRTAVWMSQTGASSVSHYNFDNDDDESTPFTSTVDRWALYDGFNNESWAGCVEARVAPYDADDTVPDATLPDTMFQPVFAPDSPVDNYLSDTPSWCQKTRDCQRVQTSTGCNSSGSNCSTGPDDVFTSTYPDGSQDNACSCSGETYLTDNTVITPFNSKYKKVRTRTCVDHYAPALSAVELQQRLCKYNGASFSGDGPNSDCPDTAILPLTNQRLTVKARIDAMIADGSTNIEQGTIWGFHSLSSTQPLTEGRAYEEATSKVMIVMTDGENNINYDTYTNTIYGVSSWMAWGYRSDKRLLTEATTPQDSAATATEVIAEVNRRTELACANAKARGILVYTIGLSVPNTTTRTMLENCATPTTVVGGVTTVYSYFPTTSAELVTVFEEIASQLSELRLAR